MKAKISLFVLLALLLTIKDPCVFCGGDARQDKALTLMIYLCGSDLESNAGAATADILEMIGSGYDPASVNILFMAGGSQSWMSGFSPEETAIYALVRGNPVRLYSDGLLNMGEASTLTSFLNYSYERSPAKSYALVIWDHGGGPLNGVCWDRKADNDNLDLFELQKALEASPFRNTPLEWLGFDACLMASAETAYMMAPYARYMIASQETEPGCGWDYNFLKGIEQDENGGETGRRIISGYFDHSDEEKADMTLSCIDLSKISRIQSAMESFFPTLSGFLDEESFSAISRERLESKGFGRAAQQESDYDLVDLKDLVLHYAPQSEDAAGELTEAIDQAIIDTQSNVPSCSGLSIYHPYYNKGLFSDDGGQSYPQLSFSPAYTSYLKEFSEIWLGRELAEWEALADADFYEDILDQDTLFSITLPEDLLAQYADAQLVILESFTDGYERVYLTDQVTLDEDGTVSAVYTGKTLYLTDDEGTILEGPIPYDMLDGRYRIPAIFYHKDTEEHIVSSLECEEDPDTGELQIRSVYIYDPETDLVSNRLRLDPESYTSVLFPFSYHLETRLEDGSLAPFAQWDLNEESFLAKGAYTLPDVWHLKFFDEQLSDSSLYALFEITDTQANIHCSELLPVENRNVRDLAITTEVSGQISTVPEFSGTLSLSALTSGIQITASYQNERTNDVTVWMSDIVINGTRVAGEDTSLYFVAGAGERAETYLDLTPEDLLCLDHISSIRFAYAVTDWEDDTELETGTITLRLDADISEMPQNIPQDFSMGTQVHDGIEWRLLQIKERYEGGLEGVILCTNLSDEPFEGAFAGIAVNSLAFFDYAIQNPGAALAPGQDTLLTFHIPEREAYEDYTEDYEPKNVLIVHDPVGQAGTDQILSLSLLHKDVQKSVVIPLSEPYAYVSHAQGNRTDSLTLYEDKQLDVRTDGICVVQDGLLISLYVRNRGDSHFRLPFQESYVNGEEAWNMFPYEEEALECFPGMTLHTYLCLGLEEFPEFLSDADLSFSKIDAGSGISACDISLHFAEEPDFTANAKAELPLSSIEVQYTQDAPSGTAGSGPLFTDITLAPDHAADLKIPISIRLPHKALQEEDNIISVQLRPCFRRAPEEHLDENDEPVKGIPFSWLGAVDLTLGKDHLCTGTFSGLLLTAGDPPGHILPIQESHPDAQTMAASLIYEEVSLADGISPFASSVPLEADFTLDYAAGEVHLNALSIYDESAEEDYSQWAASCFTGLLSYPYYGWDIISCEDDLCVLGEDLWVEEAGGYLELDGQPLGLSLVPVSKALEDPDDLFYLLRVEYEDASVEYYGPYDTGSLQP